MGTSMEREQLKLAYLSNAWAKRVDKMSDAQVIAIFRRLVDQQRIKIKERNETRNNAKRGNV